MMGKPLVSVVLPTHNRADVLPRAVRSILEQSYKNLEIIIINDASNDDTRSVIKKLAKVDDRIKASHIEKNIGAGAAYNFGIEQAEGEYIAIMDDDDIAHPQRIEHQLKALLEDLNSDLICSSIEWFDETGTSFHVSPGIITRDAFPKTNHELFKILYLHCLGIPNQTIMARAELLHRFRYPAEPRTGFDWILLMQMAASGVKVKAINMPLMKVYKGKGKQSVTSNARSRIYPMYLQSYQIIKKWLKDEGIHEFDRYHNKALSNLYLRESRHYSGFKGLVYILQGFIQAPASIEVWRELFELPNKYLKKIRYRGSLLY